MPRRHLLSTPEGLRALQRRQPPASLQGPHGFISTEVAFHDALAAHELHSALQALCRASARLVIQARVPGARRLPRRLLLDLATALEAVWPWA